MLSSTDFPKLMEAQPESCRNAVLLAIESLGAALEAGAIRNVELNDLKYTLGRAVESGWEKHVGSFLTAARWNDLPSEVQHLDGDILIMGLYSIPPTAKKLAKSTVTHPMVEAMKSFVAEVLPLAEAAAALKGKVVKGRAPRVDPVPTNPNKVVRTCPCCLRPIAVQRGTMAHHGFERPGYGHQTSSCYGIRFPPLERSSEGLKFILDLTTEQLTASETAFAERKSLTEIFWMDRNNKMQEATKGDADWERVYRIHVARLEAEISSLGRQKADLARRLSAWVQTEKG